MESTIIKSNYPAIFFSLLFISVGVLFLTHNVYIQKNGIKTTAEIIGFSGKENPCPIVKFSNQQGKLVTETLMECPGRLFKTKKKSLEISYIQKDDQYFIVYHSFFSKIAPWFAIFVGVLPLYSMLLDYYKPEWSIILC